jgi:chemotaxis protein MotB
MFPMEDTPATYDTLGADAGDGDNWLISYADLLTNLLAFFVLMFAISTVHAARFEAVSEALSGEARPGMRELVQKLEALMATPEFRDSFTVETTDDGLAIRLKEQVLFASARADVAPQGESLIAHVAVLLVTLPSSATIVVEGHADNLPISTPQFQSNWELSAARSVNVVKRLIERGVPRSSISAAAFADTRPADEDANDRARNRRVVVRVR